ncbi:MAG TPA: cytochrome c-type biogenesis protein CcmH [Gaiellaceae bacterium]
MRALLVAAAALALAAPALASEHHPTLNELENQLMCPVCQGETLAQSDTAAAAQIKRHIQQRIRQGWTRSQIKRELTAEYGTRILAAPPRQGWNLLAWVLPLVGILGGAAVIGFLAWGWSRKREEPEHVPGPASLNGRPLDPELERRLDEELARFDG